MTKPHRDPIHGPHPRPPMTAKSLAQDFSRDAVTEIRFMAKWGCVVMVAAATLAVIFALAGIKT